MQEQDETIVVLGLVLAHQVLVLQYRLNLGLVRKTFAALHFRRIESLFLRGVLQLPGSD